MTKSIDTTSPLDATLQVNFASMSDPNILDTVPQLDNPVSINKAALGTSTVLPSTLASSDNGFGYVVQAAAINLFFKTGFENCSINKFTKVGTIINGGLTVIIKNTQLFKNPRAMEKAMASAHKLLIVLKRKFTKDWKRATPIIKEVVPEYMRLCGIEDKEGARKQIKAGFVYLSNISLAYVAKEEHKNSEKASLRSFGETPLFKFPIIVKKGVITAELSDFFYEYFLSCSKNSKMRVPEWLYKYNRNRFCFARKFLEYRYININKDPNKRISIKALRKCAIFLPTEEAAKRQLKQRIKDPMRRDLASLEPHIKCRYYNPLGVLLSEEQLDKCSYNEFRKLQVEFDVLGYPQIQSKAKKENNLNSQNKIFLKNKFKYKKPVSIMRKTSIDNAQDIFEPCIA